MNWRILLVVSLLGFTEAKAQAPAFGQLLGYDVRIYLGSPAWELAEAVRHQQAGRIRHLLHAQPALARYQEPRYGQSLLFFAIATHRYRAAKALLEAGADPNQYNKTAASETPLLEAAGIYETSKFVRLLLAYGADPNLESRPTDAQKYSSTPLAEAARTRLESVKILLDHEANINQVSTSGHHSALHSALIQRNLPVIQYLLIDKQADFHTALSVTLKGDTLRIGELMKYLVYPLGSKQHQQKMALVRYLEAHGVDYRHALPPPHYYRIYSPEFLEKY